MKRLLLVAGLALLALGRAGLAHWVSPEEVLALLNGEAARDTLGVVRAVRDENAPRLLVIRVGPTWHALPAERRRDQAAIWYAQWRDGVPDGLVAILDAATDRPVVQFGPGGRVTGVAPAPPKPGG